MEAHLVTCIACKRFSFKRTLLEFAREGWGGCDLRIRGIRHDAKKERDCEDFRAEKPDVVDSRRRWLEQQK